MSSPASVFTSPRAFDPRYAPLGRLLRAVTGDRLRAEVWHLIGAVGLFLVLFGGQYLAWVLLKDAVLADPTGPTAFYFWLGQVSALASVFVCTLMGWSPPVRVVWDSEQQTLTVHQGARSLTLSDDVLRTATPVDARTVHQHYRQYAATRLFASTLHDPCVLLTTSDGPVIVSLPNAQHAAFLSLVRRQAETASLDAVSA